MEIGRMGTGFLLVYGVSRWLLADSTAGILTIVIFISKMFASLFFGFLSDKFGHKMNIVIQIILLILIMILIIKANSELWLYLIFALLGVTNAIEVISAQVIVFEFSEPERRPTYIGISSTLIGFFGLLFPLIGGWIVDIWNYEVLFQLAIWILLISLVIFIFIIKDPRKIGTIEYSS